MTRLTPLLFSCILGCCLWLLPNTMMGQKTKIKFKADNIEYDESLGTKAKRLIGNVVFEHKGATMYCDSAYQYPVSNSLDAFSNIRIFQGDSIELYGDSLHYDGDEQEFTVRYNVRMLSTNQELETDFLKYNRNTSTAIYYNGGKITNKEDSTVLTSVYGYYYTTSRDFYFKDSVRLTHPDYRVEADTLQYNTESKITYFHGPTRIFSDSNFIYCERGYYNSVTKKSAYHQNAYMVSGVQKISGDSIFFDALADYGEITGNAKISDTTQQLIVSGEKGIFYTEKDSALVTDSALLMQYDDTDTLFMHGDTMKIFKSDSTEFRKLLAYPRVRFYRKDLQGKCDSMVYAFSDSAIKMFKDPVIWSEENQLSGDYIQMNTAGGAMNTLVIDQRAFVTSMVDSLRFNQIRGKLMTGYFVDNDLERINVEGNGQTIYWGQDEEDKLIGVNRGESSNLRVLLKDNELNEIVFLNEPDAYFYPPLQFDPMELRLKGFSWLKEVRPTSRHDIFIWR